MFPLDESYCVDPASVMRQRDPQVTAPTPLGVPQGAGFPCTVLRGSRGKKLLLNNLMETRRARKALPGPPRETETATRKIGRARYTVHQHHTHRTLTNIGEGHQKLSPFILN